MIQNLFHKTDTTTLDDTIIVNYPQARDGWDQRAARYRHATQSVNENESPGGLGFIPQDRSQQTAAVYVDIQTLLKHLQVNELSDIAFIILHYYLHQLIQLAFYSPYSAVLSNLLVV